MHDTNLEERLRSVLRQEGDGLPFTITTEELERRLALRRRDRNGRRLSLMAAGACRRRRRRDLRAGQRLADQCPGGRHRRDAVAGADDQTVPRRDRPSRPSTRCAALAGPRARLPEASTSTRPRVRRSTPAPIRCRRDRTAWTASAMEATEAGVKIVCLGPDARFTWGWTSTAPPSLRDGHLRRDHPVLSATTSRPCSRCIGQIVVFDATPRDARSGITRRDVRCPRPITRADGPAELRDRRPARSCDDIALTEAFQRRCESLSRSCRADVPPRGTYLVAMVCLGDGADSLEHRGREHPRLRHWRRGSVRRSPRSASRSTKGMPPTRYRRLRHDRARRNTWHIVVTEPMATPGFIAPPPVACGRRTTRRAPVQPVSRQCVGRGRGRRLVRRAVPRRGMARGGQRSRRVETSTVALGGRLADRRQPGHGGRPAPRLGGPVRRRPSRCRTFVEGGRPRPSRSRSPASRPASGSFGSACTAEQGTDTFGGSYDIPVIIAD